MATVLAISAESKTEIAGAGFRGGPMSADKFTERLTREQSWPTTTARSDLQRFRANRMGATAYYAVDSSHVPTLSNASVVVDVIRTAAKAVRVAKGSL